MIHSFSSIKAYNTCPQQFYCTSVAKTVKRQPFDTQNFGTRGHKAFEDYITKGVPLPPEFEAFRPKMSFVKNLTQQKKCEFKMGLTREANACDFFAKTVWIRGSADLVALDNNINKGTVVDWKFGNAKRPDPDQLHMMATMVFIHNPHITELTGILDFVEENVVHTERYERDNLKEMFEYWADQCIVIERAEYKKEWPTRPSGLCRGWCDVNTCENWTPKG